jgi:hypothetical protein
MPRFIPNSASMTLLPQFRFRHSGSQLISFMTLNIFFVLVETKHHEITFWYQRDGHEHVITTEWDNTNSDRKFRNVITHNTGKVEISLFKV